jgi:hypothetical protein
MFHDLNLAADALLECLDILMDRQLDLSHWIANTPLKGLKLSLHLLVQLDNPSLVHNQIFRHFGTELSQQ